MLKEKFRWKETRAIETPRYHECVPKDVPYKYFGEITDDDYRYYESDSKRIGLSYMSDILDAYREYRENDADFAY